MVSEGNCEHDNKKGMWKSTSLDDIVTEFDWDDIN
jgi:hypothetical protein